MRVFERNLKIPGSFEHPPGSPVGFVTRGGLLLPPHGRGSRKAGRPYRRRVFQGAPQAQKRRPFPGHPSARAGHAQRRFPQWRRREAVKSLLLRTTRARRFHRVPRRTRRGEPARRPDGSHRPAHRARALPRSSLGSTPRIIAPTLNATRVATELAGTAGNWSIGSARPGGHRDRRPTRSKSIPSPSGARERGMDNPSARRRVLQALFSAFQPRLLAGFVRLE